MPTELLDGSDSQALLIVRACTGKLDPVSLNLVQTALDRYPNRIIGIMNNGSAMFYSDTGYLEHIGYLLRTTLMGLVLLADVDSSCRSQSFVCLPRFYFTVSVLVKIDNTLITAIV